MADRRDKNCVMTWTCTSKWHSRSPKLELVVGFSSSCTFRKCGFRFVFVCVFRLNVAAVHDVMD